MEYIKNTERKKYQRGPPRCPRGTRARHTPQARPGGLWGPWPASGTHFLVYKPICHRKNREETFGTERRHLEAELGQEHFCSPVERFCWVCFPLGGGNRSHRHHQRSSHRGRTNLHQHLHQHHLISNPSSSLVSNLCLKTSYWYLWVASSVDYIL